MTVISVMTEYIQSHLDAVQQCAFGQQQQQPTQLMPFSDEEGGSVTQPVAVEDTEDSDEETHSDIELAATSPSMGAEHTYSSASRIGTYQLPCPHVCTP